MTKSTTAETLWQSYLAARLCHPNDFDINLDMYFAAVELELIKRQRLHPIQYGPEIEQDQFRKLFQGYSGNGHGQQARERPPRN